jgi:tetratricopeptide (TPR) repeat protein
MRRWTFLIAFGLIGLPVLGDAPVAMPGPEPDPAAPPVAAPAAAAVPPFAPASPNVLTTPPTAQAPVDPHDTTVQSSAPSPAPSSPSTMTPVIPAGPIRDDGTIRDSLGFITVRPLPDPIDDLPPFFAQVSYLRKHGDNLGAISYLRQIVSKGDVDSQFRARAILQLSDCLSAQHQEAEALCWLKIWSETYPTRPEMGAVAYRIGALYTQMGLPDPARDAFYLALAHTINEGQVQTADDLRRYTELTTGTLWGLAANEYQCGQWSRAAELFARYRKECPTATPLSLEKAAYLEADCYYQLKQIDKALPLYEQTLAAHPFNPLAPEARLRLYHLYTIKNKPEQAREELEALAWTVRTVWPKDEVYWQKQTAEMLLSMNKNNVDVLPPLVQQAALLPPEGKTWQEALNHYDSLVSCETAARSMNMDTPADSSSNVAGRPYLPEQAELQQLDRYLNQLLPPPRTASNQ